MELRPDPDLHAISTQLEAHYTQTFLTHGATARGVDWGAEKDVEKRYQAMLDVIEDTTTNPSLLDVGCGYGGLFQFAKELGTSVQYSGVEISQPLVDRARQLHPSCRFYEGDFLGLEFAERFDYVVCNGILTQKLQTSLLEMNRYAHALIRKLFALANHGVAFNVMSTHVNFHNDRLYYRNPAELLAFCMSEITPKVRLNHHYGLYEYTLYLYR